MIDISETTRVGTTDLEICRFGLGAAHITKVEESIAIETVQYAYEHGVRFIDTAPLYGPGTSEMLIGRALAGVPRDSFVLATKIGRLIREGKPVYSYSRDSVLRSLEESLDRLQMDYVDILHIHDPDGHFQQAFDEAYPTLDDLRSQGVIKAVGAGMNQWQMLAQLAGHGDFDCFLLAGRYTLLEQTSLDFLDLCHEKKISVIGAGVYNSGILVRDLDADFVSYNYAQAPQELLERARRLAEVCDRHAVPLNIAAIQFPYGHPATASLVIGAESPDEVAANIDAVQTPIPGELWADLQREALLEVGTPVPQGVLS